MAALMTGGGRGFAGYRGRVLALAVLAAGCGSSDLWGPFGTTTENDGGLPDASTCTPDVACIPSNRCELGKTTCAGGTLQCQSLGQPDISADGQSCQQGGICHQGVCQVCSAGVSCVPANVCDLGVTACSAGQSSCQDTGAANSAANGTSCGSGQVCESGMCVACNPGSSCKVECQIGSVSCGTGMSVCTGLHPDPGSDGQPCSGGGTCKSGVCVPMQTSGRPTFPQIPDQGGSVLKSPALVTLTFQNDPNRSQLEAFGAWIAGSSWMGIVGADYGVGVGTSAGAVELTTNAPASATQQDVETLLGDGINNGSIPSPTSLGGQGVYEIYFPAGTQLSTFFGSSCVEFQGYHNYFTQNGEDIVYAVVADCQVPPNPLQAIEEIASHELIEAATDPHPRGPGPPTAWALVDIQSPWFLSVGQEVGDLCISIGETDAATGFSVQRIWSNTAAAQGPGSPCIPAPSAPFFTVSATPGTPQTVSAGGSVQFTLTGWADTPTAPWNLVVIFGGNFNSNPVLGATTISNGGTTTLTLTVPSNATLGQFGWAAVQSVESSGQAVSLWPAVVVAQ